MLARGAGQVMLATGANESISGDLVCSKRVCITRLLISKPGTQISTDSCVAEYSNRSILGRYLIT